MKLDKIFSIFNMNSTTNKDKVSQAGGLPTNESAPLASLDIALSLTKDLLAGQMDRVDSLDTKANFALGAATALVSAALLLQSLLLPISSPSSCSMLVPGFIHTLPLSLKRAIPILPLLITFFGVMITAVFAYKIRDFKQVPTPRTLLDNYLDDPEQHTKAMLFRAMVEVFEGNEQEIRNKTVWIDRAFLTLVLEALMLVLLLLYKAVC
jgi:hypothetical protein